MNFLSVVGIIVALIVAYYGLLGGLGSGISFFSGKGPLATGPGTTQIQNPQPIQTPSSFSPAGSSTREAKPKPGESPHKGIIKIATVERNVDSPGREYLIIHHSGDLFSSKGKPPIDVSGWRIATRLESEFIPRAINIPEVDADEHDIFLPPGGDLVVVSGSPSYTRNFRENKCVGYFNEFNSFSPFLSDSCPDDSRNRSALLRLGFNGACINVIESTPSCRQTRGPLDDDRIKEVCVDYINRNLNYYGCVRNFRGEKDFFRNIWRVSLRRNNKFYDSRHDRIILRDRGGLLVDEFEY